MLLRKEMAIIKPPVRFVLKRAIPLSRKLSVRLEPPARAASERVFSIPVKVVDEYVSDRLLLFFLNALDKYVPPKAIDVVIDEVEKHVPSKMRSSLIIVADAYVPETISSSRKICAVVAGFAKYVPDRIIPPESSANWSNLKMKFHVPTLISRGKRKSSGD